VDIFTSPQAEDRLALARKLAAPAPVEKSTLGEL
jgi:hypothetical protein